MRRVISSRSRGKSCRNRNICEASVITSFSSLLGEKRSSLTEVEAGETWLLVERVRSRKRPQHFPEVGAAERAAASLLVEPLSPLEAHALWTEYAEALASSEPDSPWLSKVRARQRRLEEAAR